MAGISGVGGPVYNYVGTKIESTRKGTDAKAKDKLANEIYDQLQKHGYIANEATMSVSGRNGKEAILEAIKKHISDEDSDGYLDMDLSKSLGGNDPLKKNIPKTLIDDLKSEGVIIKNKLCNKQLAADICEAPTIDKFFSDNFSFSFKQGVPAGSSIITQASDTPIQKGIDHFRGLGEKLRNGKISLNEFTAEVEKYLKANFVDAEAMSKDEITQQKEQMDGVSDRFTNQPLTDHKLQEFSRDKNGRVRVDCGGYANISAQMLKAAGWNVKFGYASMLNKDYKDPLEEKPGHILVIGTRPNGDNTDVVITSNSMAKGSTVRDYAGIDTFNQIIKEHYDFPGLEYLSIHYRENIVEAKNDSNSPDAKIERVINIALNHLTDLSYCLKTNDRENAKKEIALISSAISGIKQYIKERKINYPYTFKMGDIMIILAGKGFEEFINKLEIIVDYADNPELNGKEAKVREIADYFRSFTRGNNRLYEFACCALRIT